MANCYYQQGDSGNCYNHAYEAVKGLDEKNQVFALRLFFWGATGETITGL
jgi:hypothetical protein